MNPRRIATALRELADAFEEADGAAPVKLERHEPKKRRALTQDDHEKAARLLRRAGIHVPRKQA